MKKLLIFSSLLITTCYTQGAIYIEDIMFIVNSIKQQRGGSNYAHGIYNTTTALFKLSKLIARCEQGGEHIVNLNSRNGKGTEGNLLLNCSDLKHFMWSTIWDSRAMHDTHHSKDGCPNTSKVPTENAHRIEKSWRKILLHQDQ